MILPMGQRIKKDQKGGRRTLHIGSQPGKLARDRRILLPYFPGHRASLFHFDVFRGVAAEPAASSERGKRHPGSPTRPGEPSLQPRLAGWW